MKSLILLAISIVTISSAAQRSEVTTLGPLTVLQEKITLSGFSSGGAFAQQLQFSYSSLFCGIGVFSHNYYLCGPRNGDVDEYDRVCLRNPNLNEWYNTQRVHDDIKKYYSDGLIDNPENLRKTKLYVYAGLRSSVFAPEQSLRILQVYERYMKNPKAIKTRVQDAEFVMPTNNNYGGDCLKQAQNKSFIANCGFSGAYDALSFLLDDEYHHLYEPLANSRIRQQPLIPFNQTEFVKGFNSHYMDEIGYLYVPSGCRSNIHCLLHFYFHGCGVGREFSGTDHIANSGMLEVAELNNIIMVFPQALSTSKDPAPQNDVNPSGCWDTFGVTGENHATRKGAQVTSVKGMLDRILGRDNLLYQSSQLYYYNNYQPYYYWG